MTYRKWYRTLAITGLVLVAAPILFWILLSIPQFLYPDDCDNAARCKHWIVQISASMTFSLVLLVGPVIILLGTLLLLLSGAIYGISFAKRKTGTGFTNRWVKFLFGVACTGVLLFLAYIPNGPDECSSVLTDTRYEKCLEDLFTGMTVAETRNWLVSRGYRVTEVTASTFSSSAADEMYQRKGRDQQHDMYFQAFREYGRWRSIPYGTNFNRIFARIGPAPEFFELSLFGQKGYNAVFGVKVDWAFSFL